MVPTNPHGEVPQHSAGGRAELVHPTQGSDALTGGKLTEEKRRKSCVGGNMERIQLCPHCSSSRILASEGVLTVQDHRVVAGYGHVQNPQGACGSQELRVGIRGTDQKLLLSAVGWG